MKNKYEWCKSSWHNSLGRYQEFELLVPPFKLTCCKASYSVILWSWTVVGGSDVVYAGTARSLNEAKQRCISALHRIAKRTFQVTTQLKKEKKK